MDHAVNTPQTPHTSPSCVSYGVSMYGCNLYGNYTCAVFMMMWWHGNTFCITGPLWGESTGRWWNLITKGQLYGAWYFLVVSLNRLLNKQSSCWCFEMPWHSCDVTVMLTAEGLAVCCPWCPDLILGFRPANERRRYNVTPSLIGWAQT